MKNAIVLSIVLIAVSAPAQLTILDFEGVPDEYLSLGAKENLADYYPGVIFSPSVTLLDTERYGYADGYFPPHSPTAVIEPSAYAYTRPYPYIRADFDGFTCDNVEFYFTSQTGYPTFIEAYDASDLPIATAQKIGVLSYCQLLSLSADKIAYVIIHANGASLTIDDFAYSAMELTAIEVCMDVFPGKCPNELRTNGNAKIDVAICGSSDFDANNIDVASLEILGVKPSRSGYRDVAAPPVVSADDCVCSDASGDGFIDLTLKLDKQGILDAIGPVEDGQVVTLTLTGVMLDGTPVNGKDCLTIVKKGKN